MKVGRKVDENFNLRIARDQDGNKRTDLNDLLRRARKERKENNKYNILIVSGVVTVCVGVLLILSL